MKRPLFLDGNVGYKLIAIAASLPFIYWFIEGFVSGKVSTKQGSTVLLSSSPISFSLIMGSYAFVFLSLIYVAFVKLSKESVKDENKNKPVVDD